MKGDTSDMATQFINVVDKTTDDNGVQLNNLNYYGELSENARLKWTPYPFKPLGRVARATSSAMAATIRQYYAETFHDLRGVNITYEPMNRVFVTEFYFGKNLAPKPENKIENLVDLMAPTNTNRDNLYYRRQVINNRISGKHYTLTDQTKLLLSDVMYGGRKANKPNNKVWNRAIQEITVPSANATFNPKSVELLVKVAGCFDFNKILYKLFGPDMMVGIEVYNDPANSGNANNTRGKINMAHAVYRAKFEKYYPNQPGVFIMNIEQYDEDKVRELTLMENPVRPAAGGIIYY